jgi:hypothetical protein
MMHKSFESISTGPQRCVTATAVLLSVVLAGTAHAQTTAAVAVPDFDGDAHAVAAAVGGAEDFRTLDADIQDMKQQLLELNRDLFLLEEELLFPANTQVAVFVSMDVGDFFDLDSVQITLDEKDVSNYLYTEREVDALIRGGVHQIFLGNLRAGEHELVAIFTGVGPHERDYRRGATLTFEKGIGPKYIELTISDRQQALQPEFIVREWE